MGLQYMPVACGENSELFCITKEMLQSVPILILFLTDATLLAIVQSEL